MRVLAAVVVRESPVTQAHPPRIRPHQQPRRLTHAPGKGAQVAAAHHMPLTDLERPLPAPRIISRQQKTGLEVGQGQLQPVRCLPGQHRQMIQCRPVDIELRQGRQTRIDRLAARAHPVQKISELQLVGMCQPIDERSGRLAGQVRHGHTAAAGADPIHPSCLPSHPPPGPHAPQAGRARPGRDHAHNATSASQSRPRTAASPRHPFE